MYIDAQAIITVGAVLGALITIFGIFLKVHKWYLKQEEQSKEIDHIKKENALICYALSASLDGLMQLGANHTVPVAKDKLDKYLNETAHE
jgi:hypothetical protein